MTTIESESLKAIMQEQKETNNAKFAAVDKRFEGVDKRFDNLEKYIDKKFDLLESKIDDKFDTSMVWSKELMEKMDKRIDAVEKYNNEQIVKSAFRNKVWTIVISLLTFIVGSLLTIWGILKK